MIQRQFKPLLSNSFFIFGARGTGKTTWLRAQMEWKDAPFYDFLKPEIEDLYIRHPEQFEREILTRIPKPEWVILDEVQRVPKLLDVVHSLIESHHIKFILTGSSARKLKRGGANLLAGRAFIHHLYPITFTELGEQFDLTSVLNWGSLPKVLHLQSPEEKAAYLRSYALTYLKEEIQMEQLVRHLDPFRNFLEIAAVMNGQLLNFSKISNDVGCDIKTVQSYYNILEDTWIGFYLPSYHRSARKSQRQHPKFYLFDLGVKRALEKSLNSPLVPSTSAFGDAFEHLVIAEAFGLNEYFTKDYALSFYQTHQGAEIDLILSRPAKPPIVIEIKSATKPDIIAVNKLSRLAKDLKASKAYYLSQYSEPFEEANVQCRRWQAGLLEIFGNP